MITGVADFGESYLNFENVFMGNGSDTVVGNNSANSINGGGGNDILNGGRGNDEIFGGDGNDLLTGGVGRDSLTGGFGADVFDFNSTTESPNSLQRDTIFNFSFTDGDKIDLSTIDANLNLANNQAFKLNQLAFDAAAGLLTAKITGGADLSINLVGAQSGFSVGLDVIA
jgi:Ca2+-binding RTX toxin-like protein